MNQFDSPIAEAAGEMPEKEPTKAPEPKAPELLKFEKGDKVTFKEQDAEITLANVDGTYDVQLVDKDGNAKRDENEQPYWYPSINAPEIKGR